MINSGFIDERTESVTHFQEYELMKVTEMLFELNDWRYELTLVGLSKSEFKMFLIKAHHPTVDCRSNSPL